MGVRYVSNWSLGGEAKQLVESVRKEEAGADYKEEEKRAVSTRVGYQKSTRRRSYTRKELLRILLEMYHECGDEIPTQNYILCRKHRTGRETPAY